MSHFMGFVLVFFGLIKLNDVQGFAEGFAKYDPSTTSAGAELVYLGTTAKDAAKRSQPPIDAEAIRREVIEMAEGMSRGAFFATINKRCDQCQVRSSCPLQSDGQTVIG